MPDLKKAIARFGADAKAKLTNPGAIGEPEDQLRAPLERLFADLAELCGFKREWIAAVGETSLSTLKTRPDYAITLHNVLVGHMEVKAPGKGSDPRRYKGHDKEQWEKLQSLPNLLYTDGNSFSLWQNGELVGSIVTLGDRLVKAYPRNRLFSPVEFCEIMACALVSSPGRIVLMDTATEPLDALIRSGAQRLTGFRRRAFLAEVATAVCDGSSRQAERRFGWGRATVTKGLHEARRQMRCLDNFAARGRRRSEDKNPQLAADIRAIVEPHSYTDPELKSARRYTNVSAAEVRDALIANGHSPEELPSERTMREILNRMNYRLKRLQKGKPLKKTEETDAIFANVKAVRQQARDDPETLEISMDAQAKVGLGDYVRGGKNPDRLGR
jgi:Rhodopirellula transposase DDE domain